MNAKCKLPAIHTCIIDRSFYDRDGYCLIGYVNVRRLNGELCTPQMLPAICIRATYNPSALSLFNRTRKCV